MTSTMLTGGRLATAIKARVSSVTAEWNREGIRVTLAVVVATADESTLWYVRSIASAAAKACIECRLVDLGADATELEIATHLTELSNDSDVHGIILQTPLPTGVTAARLVGHIDPQKDIDGANPVSLGRLAVGEPAFAPATARAVIELLDYHQIPISGSHVAVVGRSAVVGKPLLHLLLQRDATVTICHSRSTPLAQFTKPAGIVAVAVGQPGLLTADHLSPGTVVIDVGTNVLVDGSLVGDADQQSVSSIAAAVSPVPGGVGSVTTALLLLHTVDAARAALGG
ncbi:MAG TPA: bifunctional 5,10-methylenetetrahydrofolate dehydrogenase/5,10-methenyltetrahydrofolate cyclohydrolase [Microlunatus sp.]|jgi:methylenetetrahydrofolate dehydrogenase (NADP+)/methenyltetrahydrofolate cyclohydrolase|nr:bifunctional 5,10-methylenetetrahydrofolate dehydrogenase/5,10-methenyltetrahydrofolate cyclohydrolase [Microlunatus sp.]